MVHLASPTDSLLSLWVENLELAKCGRRAVRQLLGLESLYRLNTAVSETFGCLS